MSFPGFALWKSAGGVITLCTALMLAPGAGAYDFLFGYNTSEYWQMPPLDVYDSFESCLQNRPDGVFCVTKVVIKPDSRSEIWRLIERNHDVLTRGVCVEKCFSLVKQLEDTGVLPDRYYEPKFNVSKRYAIAEWVLPNATEYRQKYDRLINICQNYALRSSYNLSGYTWIEGCKTNDTLTRPFDTLDVMFTVLLVTLFILTICSQYYDNWLARVSNRKDHFCKPLKGNVSTLATAFSIRRSWAKLMYNSMRWQYQRDLDFLDQLRVLWMNLILLTHMFIGLSMFTSQNPMAMEQFGALLPVQMLFALVPVEVDQFFAISGLLMAVQFLQYTEKRAFRMSILWQGLVNRYLRTLPIYAVLMLFTVSRYDTLHTAPGAYKIQQTVRRICLRKWWSHFLFINNYYQQEEQCLIHTWYLAADFQLYVVGLLVLMLLWRFPKATFWTAISLGLLGLVLPMVNTYVYAVDAMMPLSMKGTEYQLWYDEYFARAYQATELHCTSYFAGMIAGLLYHKIARKELTLGPRTIRRVFNVTSVLTVVFALQAPLYNMINFSKPSVWMAILCGALKVTFAALFASTFLLLAFHDPNSALRRWFAGNRLSRAMAKLGFGFYIVQMPVLWVIIGNYPEDTRVNLRLAVSTYCSAFVLSYAIALVAYVMVEKPFDVIFKLLLGGGNRNDRRLPETFIKSGNVKPELRSMTLGSNGLQVYRHATEHGVSAAAGTMYHQGGGVSSA